MSGRRERGPAVPRAGRRVQREFPRLSAIITAVCLVTMIAGCRGAASGGAILSGDVFDAANGMPVRGARVSFGGKSTVLYTTRSFRLSGLSAREGTLKVVAPGYQTLERRITLGRESLSVDVPLTGIEVPGLAGILAWAVWEKDALRIDVRLQDAAGVTLEHYPCLDFRLEARLAENLGTREAPRRGRLLFEGVADPSFDPAGGLDKLKGRIPRSRIATGSSGTRMAALDVTLVLPQGCFSWSRFDVELEAR